MNALAIELDRTLETSSAYGFLSSVGRRMYFPKGIVAQSDEAKEKAKTYNATVGLATSKGQPMHLSDIMDMLREGEFKPSEIFNYAPGGGDKALRAIWKDEMVRKNPSLEGKLFSLPLVTAGLTHTISMLATLFFDEGDSLVLPDLFWDNYDLVFGELRGAQLHTFPFFKDGGFNTEGMKAALATASSIYLARTTKDKDEVARNMSTYYPGIEERALLLSLPGSCSDLAEKSAPHAFACFLMGESYEDTLRLALARHGDVDTEGAIACSIAEAFYGPENFPLASEKALHYFNEELLDVIHRFQGMVESI